MNKMDIYSEILSYLAVSSLVLCWGAANTSYDPEDGTTVTTLFNSTERPSFNKTTFYITTVNISNTYNSSKELLSITYSTDDVWNESTTSTFHALTQNTTANSMELHISTENSTSQSVEASSTMINITTAIQEKEQSDYLLPYICGGAALLFVILGIVIICKIHHKGRKKETSSKPLLADPSTDGKELPLVVVTPPDNDVQMARKVSTQIGISVDAKPIENGNALEQRSSQITVKSEGSYELAKIIRTSSIRSVDSTYDDIDFSQDPMNCKKVSVVNVSQTSLVSATEGEYDILGMAVENRRQQCESIYAHADDDETYSHIDNAGEKHPRRLNRVRNDYDDVRLNGNDRNNVFLSRSTKSLSIMLLNENVVKPVFPSRSDYNIMMHRSANETCSCKEKCKGYRKSNIF